MWRWGERGAGPEDLSTVLDCLSLNGLDALWLASLVVRPVPELDGAVPEPERADGHLHLVDGGPEGARVQVVQGHVGARPGLHLGQVLLHRRVGLDVDHNVPGRASGTPRAEERRERAILGSMRRSWGQGQGGGGR